MLSELAEARYHRSFRLLSLMAVVMSLTDCADPCTELQAVCDTCQAPGHRTACEASVDAAVIDQCELDIEDYGRICN